MAADTGMLGKRQVIAWCVAAATMIGAGCGTTYMQGAGVPTPLAPEAGQATIVFVRPSDYGTTTATHIVADEGVYLGTLEGAERMVVRAAAGPHRWVTWSENTDTVRGTVEAGKVYYVLVKMRHGIYAPRHALKVLSPAWGEWAELPTWLTETDEVVRLPGARGAGPDAEVIAAKLTRADAVWGELEAEARTERTVTPEHGHVPEKVAPPLSAAAKARAAALRAAEAAEAAEAAAKAAAEAQAAADAEAEAEPASGKPAENEAVKPAVGVIP